METLNPFDLLDDDAEDPSQIGVSIAADKPKKPALVSAISAKSSAPLRQLAQPGAPRGGGRRGEAGDGERPRRTFERRCGTGKGGDLKREGAGRGNWGTPGEDVFVVMRKILEGKRKALQSQTSGRSDNRFQAHYNSSGMHSVVIFLRRASWRTYHQFFDFMVCGGPCCCAFHTYAQEILAGAAMAITIGASISGQLIESRSEHYCLRAADANKISETSTVTGSGYNKISDGSGFAKGNCGAGEGVREIYYNGSDKDKHKDDKEEKAKK
ncbi:hypothetical protein F2Q69_00045132, partial [Brassica cretica]